VKITSARSVQSDKPAWRGWSMPALALLCIEMTGAGAFRTFVTSSTSYGSCSGGAPLTDDLPTVTCSEAVDDFAARLQPPGEGVGLGL
jgi:hypothetical protein